MATAWRGLKNGTRNMNFRMRHATRPRPASQRGPETLVMETGRGFWSVCFQWDRTGSRTCTNGHHWVSRAGTTDIPLTEEETGLGGAGGYVLDSRVGGMWSGSVFSA